MREGNQLKLLDKVENKGGLKGLKDGDVAFFTLYLSLDPFLIFYVFSFFFLFLFTIFSSSF